MEDNVDSPQAIAHLSLCSGYGGIDLGLKRVLPALRTIAYVEIEAFACANLVAKIEAGELDAAPVWTNLKTLPLEVFRDNVSIVSGGFPCQPFSAAGKRSTDEDKRHLFPYIKNAIRVIQPEWIFLENVEGIISAKLKGDGWEDPAGTPVLLHVLRELERVGYRCAWGVFSASECLDSNGLKAPHQRKRVFILANRNCAELEGLWECNPTEGRQASDGYFGRSGNLWPARPGEPQFEWEEPRVAGDTDGALRLNERGVPREEGRTTERSDVVGTSEEGAAELANPSSQRSGSKGGDAIHEGRPTGAAGGASLPKDPKRGIGVAEPDNQSASGNGREGQYVADAHCGGGKKPELQQSDLPPDSGAELADASKRHGERRASRIGGRQRQQEEVDANAPGDEERQIKPVMGRAVDGSAGRVDATANRVDRLRLLGNGVLPATVELAFRTLYEELEL